MTPAVPSAVEGYAKVEMRSSTRSSMPSPLRPLASGHRMPITLRRRMYCKITRDVGANSMRAMRRKLPVALEIRQADYVHHRCASHLHAGLVDLLSLTKRKQADRMSVAIYSGDKVLYTSADVTQVNISAETGDMGILANHVPSIEALWPGLVDVIESNGTTKKFFVAAGFSWIRTNELIVVAPQAAPLEDFSLQAVEVNLREVQAVIFGNGTEAEKAEACIAEEVYKALRCALLSQGQ